MPKRKKVESSAMEGKDARVSDILEEVELMKPARVKLDSVFLDPNNPRLEYKRREPTPSERVMEKGVQDRCLEDLNQEGLRDLLESIKESGFLTIDRVVLKKFDTDKYIVIEGNRRVAALKILAEGHKGAQLTLHESIIRGIREFDALVYEGDRKDIAWIVQGFRHSPDAIKKWEDFAKAKFFADMIARGKTTTEITRTFSVQRSKLINLIRSYHGFQQAREDEDYGDQLIPAKHFSFFSNIIFDSKNLRDEWLNWNDDKHIFENEENLSLFLSWILDKQRDVTISTLTRDTLSKLVSKSDYEDLLERFKEDNKLTIQDVCELIKLREPPKLTPIPDIPTILDNLIRIKTQIESLPLITIQRSKKTGKEHQQKEQIIDLLREINEALNEAIDMLGSE